MKSTLAKKEEVQRKWYVVDATGQTLGRLSVKIANILRGRDKPTYTPHVDTGDFVIVINAEKIAVTGKKEEQKKYMFYTGWVGNEYYRNLADFRDRKPEFIIQHAVKGMMPRNNLGRQMLRKLKIYSGSSHPHEAQEPIAL
ncbi:MAG: 50S ribosomal protein L13 [Verrucomicrobiae bacterium]|nr:50S ribosomal protein L13 [Verrucomicrobiae bacterium]